MPSLHNAVSSTSCPRVPDGICAELSSVISSSAAYPRGISTRSPTETALSWEHRLAHGIATDAYVFGNGFGEHLDSVKTAWKATCRRASIEDLHFHDLRREAACRWFEAGVPLHHIRDLLGHADISTTSRYLAVTPTGMTTQRTPTSFSIPSGQAFRPTGSLGRGTSCRPPGAPAISA